MHDESDKYLVGIAALGIGAFPRGAPRLDPTNFQALCAAAAQSALIGARRVAVGTEIGGGNAKSPRRLYRTRKDEIHERRRQAKATLDAAVDRGKQAYDSGKAMVREALETGKETTQGAQDKIRQM